MALKDLGLAERRETCLSERRRSKPGLLGGISRKVSGVFLFVFYLFIYFLVLAQSQNSPASSASTIRKESTEKSMADMKIHWQTHFIQPSHNF